MSRHVRSRRYQKSDYPDPPAALKGTFTIGTERGALKTVELDELSAYQGAVLRAPVLYNQHAVLH